MAGEVGQVSLALSAESASGRARIDQHAAAIREALSPNGAQIAPGTLVSYARGFTEAAIGRGWWPTRRLREPGRYDVDADDLDWESLRLAAVCNLLIETEPRK
jgi:Family of unknown function (DUF6401)